MVFAQDHGNIIESPKTDLSIHRDLLYREGKIMDIYINGAGAISNSYGK